MSLTEVIIQTSIVLGALTTIVVTIYKCKKSIKDWLLSDINERIDETHRKIDEKVGELNKRMDELYLKDMANAIMELIHHDPNNKQSIMLLHDEYKKR
jgi:hypothetical protein